MLLLLLNCDHIIEYMYTIKLFFRLFFREMISPVNYLFSFIAGASVNFFTSGNPLANVTLFLVLIIVQSYSKATVHLINRKKEILLLLPKEWEDPAFITDRTGKIVAAIGYTEELFKEHKILNIKDLLIIDDSYKENTISEAFSTITQLWYSVKVKKVDDLYLIWMENINDSVNLELRIGIQRQFSNDIINSLSDLVYQNDIYDRLARMILLDNYEGVFFTRYTDDRDLKGTAYKFRKGKYEKSHTIEVSSDSSAPVNLSRKKDSIVTDSLKNYKNRAEFEKANPFNNKIKDFMDHNIFNFVNYHKGDITIIAFNNINEVTSYDLRTMESAVDNARVVSSLLDMARENDARFLESMAGLCAAAEFSDEITGKHIYRVNKFSQLIAGEYGLDEKICIWLGQVAAIHDIGKVAMPDVIKINRQYTTDERSKMQIHTIIGSQIISKMIKDVKHPDERFLLAQKIALNHHQEWCGKGYPGLMDEENHKEEIHSLDPGHYSSLRPLKGEEIPIEALIVSLADRYDALRSPRHYKEGFSHEKTMEIITLDNRSGRSGEEIFGPAIFQVFLKIHGQMDEIYNSMSD